jgi:outer membrane protein assembly factor BamA
MTRAALYFLAMKKLFPCVAILALAWTQFAAAQRCPLPIPSFQDEVRQENANSIGIKKVHVARVDIESTPSIPAEIRRDILKRVVGRTYEVAGDTDDRAPDWSEEVAERVRFGLQEYGYYKALISDPEVRPVGDPGPTSEVAVFLKVELGAQYRTGDISFKNATEFSPEQLRAAIPLHAGDAFDVDGVRKGLEALREMYGSKGFVSFTPIPDTRIDDARHTISLTIEFDEGAVFRVGRVIISGADDNVVRALAEQNGLMTGAVFNSLAVKQFAARASEQHLLPTGFDLARDVSVRPRPEGGLVDITIDVLPCPTTAAARP